MVFTLLITFYVMLNHNAYFLLCYSGFLLTTLRQSLNSNAMILMFQQIHFKSFCFSKTNPFGIKKDKSTVQSTE